jgi:predicted signal transduction protein with EAL and GGDEF domain
MGCQEGQGYHYGRPVPAREFEERFLAHTPGQTAAAAGPVLAEVA